VVSPTQQIYLCLELINVIYPVLKRMPNSNNQLSILHETLFQATDCLCNSKNDLNDMLLLLTFTNFRETLFKKEFKRRLSKVLQTILKPKLLDDCPALHTFLATLFGHFRSDCLGFMVH